MKGTRVMPKLLLSLSDTEKEALRKHASESRSSMHSIVLLALDKHVPGFRSDTTTSKPKASAYNDDLADLVFDEE